MADFRQEREALIARGLYDYTDPIAPYRVMLENLMTSDGRTRVQQFVGFMFSLRDLAKFMRLPRDHRIVKIDVTGRDYMPPGVTVIIEGPAGSQYLSTASPVYFGKYDQWLAEVDSLREDAIKNLGPYEW